MRKLITAAMCLAALCCLTGCAQAYEDTRTVNYKQTDVPAEELSGIVVSRGNAPVNAVCLLTSEGAYEISNPYVIPEGAVIISVQAVMTSTESLHADGVITIVRVVQHD